MTSDIAHFRECQTMEEQAGYQGLYGYAIVSRHDFIESRIEQGAERILALMREGHTQEALALLESPLWGVHSDLP